MVKLGNITAFGMLSLTQRLEGITSKVSDDKHMILLDLEGASLEQAVEALRKIQLAYGLGDFWVTSDAEGSYRAWCFSVRPWTTYLRMMLDLLDHGVLDYNFYFWTVKRGEATLRTSNKLNRPPQKVVAYLPGYEETAIPKKLKLALYDTGLEKRGLVLRLPIKRR